MRSNYAVTLCALWTSALMGGPMIASAAPPSQMEQAKAKENKADQTSDSNSDRDVIQILEHAKKELEAEKAKDPSGRRAAAIAHIQQAMGDIRAKTSKPGH